MISPGKPRIFKAGAIVENADELVEGKEYRFYLFKVVVGKSYCYRRKKEDQNYDDYSNIILPPNYDSVYLEGEAPANTYQHRYLVYNKDCILRTYLVETKIEIDDSDVWI